jgi:hypothetical protein
MYPGALNYASTSMNTTDESTYGDYLISPCSHQDKFYQPMTVPHTALIPSSSLPLPQVDFFRTLGYMPHPLTHEDLFNILGYTPTDTTQIHGTTSCQSSVLESQFIPPSSQQRRFQESAPQPIAFQPHVQAHLPMVLQLLLIGQQAWPWGYDHNQ